jgi:DNA-directed RNA polymerase subunit alpha
MQELQAPSIEWSVETDQKYGKFTVQPLERGYGLTLGNALRRVLLSSLPGAAITSIQVEGVLHEFSTIPGVFEDTTDIILNLKAIRLKVSGNAGTPEEPLVLRLRVEKEGTVYARDFDHGPEIEILTPDQPVATVDAGGRLVMEATVQRGRGYVPADHNKQPRQAIGVIPIDSIYAPITRVNYKVEHTRVGQVTDYDKLELEVWTDGSITPQDALSQSARLLVDQMQHLTNLGSEPTVATGEQTQATGEQADTDLMNKPIDELDLSVRSYNSLKRAGIHTVGQLVEKTEAEMMKIRNLGKKSLEEISEKLAALGLSLSKEED